jgi:ATP-binding cassette subfamily B multidrug efflux pump
MIDDDDRRPVDWTLVRRLIPHLRGEARLYAVALAAAPVSTALSVLQPWLLKRAIDDHLAIRDVDGVKAIAIAYLGATLFAFFAETVYTVALSYAATGTIGRLRRAVYEKTIGFAQSFFDHRPTGRLLTRATSDVEALGETLTAGAVTIVLDALLVVGILAAMFSLDARLTLITLALAPLIAFAVDRIRRILRDLYTDVRNAVSSLNAFAAERLAGMEIIQLYSDESRAIDRHDALLEDYRQANIKTNLWDALLYALIDGTSAVTMALLLYYGSGGLFSGVATAGLLAAFIDYTARLYRPIQEFSAKVAILQRAGTSLERIFSLLDHEEHIGAGRVALPNPRGEIEVDRLSFSYGTGPEILHDVSFRVAPGEVVALVGRTGSGKSSIARILTRTYDGYRGSIRLDGLELSDIHPHDVRRALAMVRQDVQLFPGDIRFNLTLGRNIPDARLHEAIRVVQAEDVVARLGGLDGAIAHQGSNLSVGEAQLLNFARVMAHDAPVVLLDEATASIDTLTETRIQAATRALFQYKTVVVIAHRLSTVVDADRIVVLDAGRVAEMGSHAELLAANGAWARLYRQQFVNLASEAPEPSGS